MNEKEIPANLLRLTPLLGVGAKALALDCEVLLGPNGPLPMAEVTHMRFAQLTVEILSAIRPGMIILPLFSVDYDAACAVEILEAMGFTGVVTVLAPELPKPRVVERELRSLCPGMRLTLISP